MESILVLCCRPDRAAALADPTVRAALGRCGDLAVEFVGPRPDKGIDPMLAGRIVVLGDDTDLAAVVLRLMRRELLGKVIVGFATDRSTSVTELWSLPLGSAAVKLAIAGDPDLVPVVRDDVGGVLVGLGGLLDVRGTVYVDEKRVLQGSAAQVLVEPHTTKGLSVTVVPRRILGFGRRPTAVQGRAVSIGTAPATVLRDGVTYDRPMNRWTFYKHTEPLRLVRGVL
ncbi:hypothetical protein ABIB25_001567 [Nakamurella sp. UYEF19]|uniref:hypothetical protein n=1 Tax=Nakamurella sp. UYEF19 TaxID=1756392 RepID=UPI003394FAF3